MIISEWEYEQAVVDAAKAIHERSIRSGPGGFMAWDDVAESVRESILGVARAGVRATLLSLKIEIH